MGLLFSNGQPWVLDGNGTVDKVHVITCGCIAMIFPRIYVCSAMDGRWSVVLERWVVDRRVF